MPIQRAMAALGPGVMTDIQHLLEAASGERVEYVSITFKLQDRRPETKTHRAGLYDRELPKRYGKEQTRVA